MHETCKILAGLLLAASAGGLGSAAAYQERGVEGAGVISGRVTLGSAEVQTQTFTVTKDTEVCGTGTRTVEAVRANGDALLDVVVYLENVEAGKPFTKEAGAITLDQKNCRFEPYLQVMANGGELTVLNPDPVLHNIRAYELFSMGDNETMRRTIFNVSLPNFETLVKRLRLRRSHVLKLECSAHEYMHAWIFVAANPYYAVVDDDGAFMIAGVPPGSYVLKSWHGQLGERHADVEVTAGGRAAVNFSY